MMSLQHQPISTPPDATQLPEALRVAMDLWATKLNYNELLQSMQVNVADTWKVQKDQSLQTRKVLAETTKQFKKSVKAAEQAAIQLSNDTTTPNATTELVVTSIDTLSNECRSTVKLYQEEIDSLTRRCKNVEQEYSAVYAKLVDVPDPTILFRHCNDVVDSQNQQMLQLLSTIESLNREWQQAEKLSAEYKEKNQELTQANNSSGKLSNEERDELISLRKEVTEYEVEFRSLKNQDITIRKLEEKIDQLQLEAEESIRTAVETAKEEVAQAEAQQMAELLERENMLQVKIQTLELQLHSERTSYQLSQQNLSKVDDHMSNQQTIWDVQRNILMDDNTRVREQLQIMTRERDDLLNEIAVYRNISVDGSSTLAVGATAAENLHPGSSILRSPASMTDLSLNHRAVATGANGVVSFQDLLLERNAYEAEVSELTETNVMLREELRQKEDVILREKRTLQSKIDALERERTSLQNNISTLETQLSSAPSRSAIENMKRELRLLKRLEYNAEENNDDDDCIDKDRDPELTAGVSNSAAASDESDLETILVNKLRHAEKELILERNLKNELSEKIETLQQQLLTTDQAKKECEQLIVSLEKDLQRAITQATPTITQSKHKVDVVPQLSEENASATLQHILDPSVPPPPATPASLVSTPSTTKATSEKADDDHSVATIIMAQRDRLRVRCDALEAERDSFKRELQYQVQTLESLKSDNTKLYEKVRYLQNYNSNKGSTSVSGNSGGLNQRSVGWGGDRDLDLEALEQRYEASVDPFKQFSKSERQRKLNEMSPMERAVFVVAKTVLCTSSLSDLYHYDILLLLSYLYSLLFTNLPLPEQYVRYSDERNENWVVLLCSIIAFVGLCNDVQLVARWRRM